MRKHYADNIRWITVILVVLYHVIYMYNGVATAGVIGPFYPVQYQDILQYILYPWFMVILFIISGMSTRYYLEKHTIKEFVAARTRKLLVPSTIGLFVFQWILGYFSMSISHAFDYMPDTMPKFILYLIMSISGTGVLWYIQMLWLFSMVIALIRRFEKGKLYHLCQKVNVIVLLLLGILVWLTAQILNTPIITVYRFGIYGFSFLLGYFILAHEEVIERLSKYRHILLVAAIVLGCGYVYYYFGENYAIEPVVNSPFSIAYAWLAILAIFACMKKIGDKSTPLTTWMSQKSFGLYVFHYLPLAATAYIINVYTEISAFPAYIITGVAAFAGGYLLNEVISRIPILRWCVLGIRKKGKHV
ncbi:MAG: acyltransferase [Lachnospiraceae bacterium]|nr:acyltransferase [Lachnospiraceae bacterium]